MRTNVESLEARTLLAANAVELADVRGSYGWGTWVGNGNADFRAGAGTLQVKKNSAATLDVEAVSRGGSDAVLSTGKRALTFDVNPSGHVVESSGNVEGFAARKGKMLALAELGPQNQQRTGISAALPLGRGLDESDFSGRYHFVVSMVEQNRTFGTSIGFLDANGAGDMSGTVTRNWPGQPGIGGIRTGPLQINDPYSIGARGRFRVQNVTGQISPDGEVGFWTSVPGSVQDRPAALWVALRRGNDLNTASVRGRYNFVFYNRGDGKISSGIGYLDANGKGRFTRHVFRVAQGQAGSWAEVGRTKANYSVSADGTATFGGFPSFVSRDGSTIISAMVADQGSRENGILLMTRAGAVPTVSVTASDRNAAEPGNIGVFTLRRTGSTDHPLAVPFAVSGRAINGTDYQPIGPVVEIPAGQRSLKITVRPVDDAIAEPSERVKLSLKSTVDFSVKSGAESAVIKLADDDGADAAAAAAAAAAAGKDRALSPLPLPVGSTSLWSDRPIADSESILDLLEAEVARS